MNERIKQLEAQCWESRGSHPMGDRFNTEKFAELIVKECGRVADDAYDRGLLTQGGAILKHFGVE